MCNHLSNAITVCCQFFGLFNALLLLIDTRFIGMASSARGNAQPELADLLPELLEDSSDDVTTSDDDVFTTDEEYEAPDR